MEHPFLALQKRRTKPITYKNGKVQIEVSAPEKYGIASIWDWDIIIGIGSHINELIEGGLPHSKKVSFAPFNLLRTIKRGTGGKDYKELAAAIRRLFATSIITNVRLDDQSGIERPFRWIENYAIPTRYTKAMTPDDDQGDADPTKPWTVELPDWLYNAIVRRKGILAVHEHYFDLTSGIARALYRLARKSVPDDGIGVWQFRMDTLHHQLGVTSSRREFGRMIREIAETNNLPEYVLVVQKKNGHETVTFIKDRSRPPRARRGVYKPSH
jgi:plasmid replication initiation protein